MIVEERRLSFSRVALVDAVVACAGLDLVCVPVGQIVDVTIARDGACRFLVERLGGSFAELSLSPAQVVALLIMYAKALDIPIPRRAAKSLDGSYDGVGLVLRQQRPTRTRGRQIRSLVA